jgi:hypothetical protein
MPTPHSNRIRTSLKGILGRAGLEVRRTSGRNNLDTVEATLVDQRIYEFVRPETMTSRERIWAALQAVHYTVRRDIPGDVVECGVWRGGTSMAMALKLLDEDATDRDLWLFDTYSGMTAPTDRDVAALTGMTAAEEMRQTTLGDGDNVWAYASLAVVQKNMARTNFPSSRIHYVVGDILTTVPDTAPDRISLLRLDTDWYESTRHSLHHLYPRLAVGGVCIADDYGHWGGARKAIDEYFTGRPPELFGRVDYTGRMWIKTVN